MATSIISNHLFQDDLISLIEKKLNKVTQSFFFKENDFKTILKGGNKYNEEIKRTIGSKTADLKRISLIVDLGKKSDIDFSIDINPKMDDQVFEEVAFSVFAAFCHSIGEYHHFISKIILSQNEKNSLAEEIKAIRAERTEDVEIITIQYENEEIDKNFVKMTTTHNLLEKTITTKKQPFIVSYEDVNVSEKNLDNSYFLVRIKIRLNVLCKINNRFEFITCESEMIDVTIPKKSASSLIKLYSKGINYFLRKNEKFDVYEYNLKGHINDLEDILFEQIDHPWENFKWEKRTQRLLIAYFLANTNLFQEFYDVFVCEKKINRQNKKSKMLKGVKNLVGLVQDLDKLNKYLGKVKDVLLAWRSLFLY